MKNKAFSIVILIIDQYNNLTKLLDWFMTQLQINDVEYIIADAVGMDLRQIEHSLVYHNVCVLHLDDKIYQNIAELKNDVIKHVKGDTVLMVYANEFGEELCPMDILEGIGLADCERKCANEGKQEHFMSDFNQLLLDGDKSLAGLWVNVKTVLSLGGWQDSIACGEDYELLLRIYDYGSRGLLDSSRHHVTPIFYKEINKPVYQSIYYTYAYIFGKYSDTLKKRDIFDSAFQNRYQEAVNYGIKDYFIEFAEKMISKSQEFLSANQNNPIVIIMDSSMCNGAMQSFAEGLCNALIERGQGAVLADTNKQDFSTKMLMNIAGCDCKAVIGFQTDVFARQMPDGSLWGNLLLCPKFNIIFDHPLFISYYLMLPIKNYYICSQDEGYVSYIKAYYPNISNVWHLPPAGIIPKAADLEKTQNFSQRKWNVTFIAAYNDYRQRMNVVRSMTSKEKKIALKLMIYLKNNPNTSASGALQRVLDCAGIKLENREFVIMLHHMMDVVRTITFYYREKIIKTLLLAGIDIHVFSDTWKSSPFADNERLFIHSDVRFEECAEIMADSKVSLNIMSWHKGGMTERIANAMLAGSVCVSDTTSYLEKNFTDGVDIVLFSLEEIELLPEKIKNLLADSNTAGSIAEKGKANALKNHTWGNRADAMLAILHEINGEEISNSKDE